ncbi:hypothetical protein E5676_scaffold602G001310 [Cucumis melo var. makuwa]|uniref:Uncharacterized protein n=1 Tax=Cucumis melo var. makuwa TaxID=1194695 RepID=A0A5D3BP68_CUCMM|nr:hypothetical protein E6C27_scaffold21G003850 [Cucumis melo var. makuwa]TYK00955.1 hypothetical protein E5676_scaffold602G001310 [Cucumis melo var. makuwa]
MVENQRSSLSREENQYLHAKNSIMTFIVGAKSEADLQAVMETVIHTIFNDNKEDNPENTRISLDSSINDINFDNDPYYNFDIFDLYLDSQPG